MKARHKRFALIGIAGVALALAATLVLNAFQKNLVFFFTPTQIVTKEAPVGRTFRVGGLVEPGSLKRQPDGVTVNFVVTDTANKILVSYKGVLPDLFKEGKGVETQGRIDSNGVFEASEVLAKHDENYMPPEAADAVAKAHKGAVQAKNGMPPGASTVVQQ
jgi:cytochrome c-type biogenesis protein CcmE